MICRNCNSNRWLYGLAVGSADKVVPYCSKCGERVMNVGSDSQVEERRNNQTK